MSQNDKAGFFIPALVGGAVAGVLTGIPLINCLCCLWIIGGGVIAAYFLNKESHKPITTGDGAIVGVFAGIVAAVIDFLISIPLAPISNAFFRNMMERFAEYAEEMPAAWDSWLERGFTESTIPMMLFGMVINAVIFSVLGALGGIIGVSMFKKKQRPAEGDVIDVSQNTNTP